MPTLPLTPDQLLTTTRAVRKRLDFDRPVERAVIEECLEIALQAPTGGNRQRWHFVVVTDPAKRRAIADLYRKSWAVYLTSATAAPNLHYDDPAREASQRRVGDSAQYLADHLERADWPHKKMAGEMKAFFGRMAAAMRVWVETCREIGY